MNRKGGVEQKGDKWMVVRAESGMRVYVGTYASQSDAELAYEVANLHYQKELDWIRSHRKRLSEWIKKAIDGKNKENIS